MTRDEGGPWGERYAEHDPCTQGAREEGCTCRMESVNSASIDPPEPIIDKYCPLHGYAPDPDMGDDYD